MQISGSLVPEAAFDKHKEGEVIAVDLFCGLGGWAHGLLAEGWTVIGFDIERHEYGDDKYPGLLVIQDVMTLHGSQFKTADLIVASPPCQAYSYRAMPWKRAKALPPPDNTLFDACFRIQREACEAAGRHIPMIVENVRGAQKWVGRSRWNFGSFHMWGDVPALMPMTQGFVKMGGHRSFPHQWLRDQQGLKQNPHPHLSDDGSKLGGSWFHGYRKGQGPRNHGSNSRARTRASAMIAKIPFPLAQHIARVFKP